MTKKLELLTNEQKIEYLRSNPIYWGKLGFVNDATASDRVEEKEYIELQKQLDTFENIFNSGIEVFSFIFPSGWVGVNEYDYTIPDFLLEKFFERLPNAYILPRINLNVPISWCYHYPNDVFVYSNGPKTAEEIKALVGTNDHDYCGFPYNVDGKNGDHINKDGVIARQSFTSEQWKKDASIVLEKIVKRIESSPYADRVIGYHITYGMCGETSMWGAWESELFKHGDYGINTTKKFIEYAKNRGVEVDSVPSPACREIIKDKDTIIDDYMSYLKNEAVVDKTYTALFYDTAGEKASELYSRFISENNADAITRFCSVVKNNSKNKLAGIFYGYIVDIHNPCDTGHLAIDKILSSPYVDFVAGPKGYCRVNSGEPGFPQAVTESINLKKLWLDEVDNRTHLASSIDCNVAENMAQTRSQFWREFTKNLSAKQGYWWMDLGGGWYDDNEIIDEMRLLKETGDLLAERKAYSVTEVLLVLDDEAMHKMRPHTGLYWFNTSRFCSSLKECGAPIRLYRRSDIENVDLSGYKLIIFLNPYIETKESFAKIQSKLNKDTVVMFGVAPAVYNGKTAELKNVEEFLDMKLGLLKIEKPLPEFEWNTLPIAYVKEQDGVTPIARYSTGDVKLAIKNNIIFCALPETLTLEEIRDVFKLANVHLYAGTGFSINADSRFVFVTSVQPFNGTIKMPKKVNAKNLFTNEYFENTDTLKCNYLKGESAFFLID